MTTDELKNKIDSTVSNETARGGITHQEVGEIMKDIVDAGDKEVMIVEGVTEVPTANPASLTQRWIDSKKRFYDAVGTSSLLEWEVTKPIGARGVKTDNVNLYTPSDVNRTFEYWLNPNPTVALNSIYLQFGSGADYISIFRYASGFHFFVRKNNVVLLSYNIPLRTTHIVIDLCSLNSVSIYINGVLKFNADMSGANLQFSSKYLQNSVSYIIREYNFKPTNEQVREWYNTGRVDRYELPVLYKNNDYGFKEGVDAKELIDATGIDETTRIYYNNSNTAEVFEDGLFKAKIKIKSITNNAGYLRLFKSGIGSNIVVDTINLSDMSVGSEYVYEIRTSNPSFSFIWAKVYDGGILTFDISFEKMKVLHEYKGSNVQPHKLVDTGATPEDILLNGATPTFELPYQEFISAEGAPTVIPQIEQQSYEDLTNKDLYKSVGTTSASDWKKINN